MECNHGHFTFDSIQYPVQTLELASSIFRPKRATAAHSLANRKQFWGKMISPSLTFYLRNKICLLIGQDIFPSSSPSLSLCRLACGCPFRLLPRCVAGRPVIVTVCFRQGFVILCCQVEHAHWQLPTVCRFQLVGSVQFSSVGLSWAELSWVQFGWWGWRWSLDLSV